MKKFITMVLSLIILSILFLATSCSGSRDDTQDVIGGKIVMYAAPGDNVQSEIRNIVRSKYPNVEFQVVSFNNADEFKSRLDELPMWFKHFGTGPAGAGEAYHIGVFGRTGSGKSVLAKMITLAYARHADMGIFILIRKVNLLWALVMVLRVSNPWETFFVSRLA